MALAGTPYGAAIPVYDPKISETRHAGLTVLRLCACGLPLRSMPRRLADGTLWQCTRCGRKVQ